MTYCNIVPDHLLKKIKDKNTLKVSQQLRRIRTLRLERQIKEGIKIPDPKPHDEIRALFDAKGSLTSGTLIQVDKQIHSTEPSTSPELQQFNLIYDMIHDVLQRESFDDHNAVMRIYKNVGKDLNNAFWDGNRFAFGSGDQETFRTFFIQNVASHECFHAVTEYTAGLIYKGQAGALNESMSDVFAICLDHLLLNQKPEEAEWIIGNGVFMGHINAKGLRSFKDELAYDDQWIGKDIQPKHMRNYNITLKDNGGVHINSGIMNHVFYQFCMITGEYSWKMPLNVWYNALLLCRPDTNFQRFADTTLYVCLPEYQHELYQAWKAVGITPKLEPKHEHSIIRFFKNLLFIITRLLRR